MAPLGPRARSLPSPGENGFGRDDAFGKGIRPRAVALRHPEGPRFHRRAEESFVERLSGGPLKPAFGLNAPSLEHR